jgi:hypothetical protein
MITRRFKIWLVINVLALAAASAVVVTWPSLASTLTFVFLGTASGLFPMEVRQKWAIEESKRKNETFGDSLFFQLASVSIVCGICSFVGPVCYLVGAVLSIRSRCVFPVQLVEPL